MTGDGIQCIPRESNSLSVCLYVRTLSVCWLASEHFVLFLFVVAAIVV